MIKFSRLVSEKLVATNSNITCCDIRYFWIKTYRQLQMDPNHSFCKSINYNLRQNVWNKVEKSSEIRQDKKIFLSTFACFLTVITKFNPWKRDWVYGCLNPNLRLCEARYRASFPLWRLGPVLKHCKVLKYCEQNCLDYLHFQLLFTFLERVLIWLKNVTSIKKLPITKAEGFLKSNFDLNQIWKKVLTENH